MVKAENELRIGHGERDKFIESKLDTPKRRELLGDQYQTYSGAILRYVAWLDTPVTKRPDLTEIMRQWREEGLSNNRIFHLRKTAVSMYGRWLEEKKARELKVTSNTLGRLGGRNPHIDEGGHRGGLGYSDY